MQTVKIIEPCLEKAKHDLCLSQFRVPFKAAEDSNLINSIFTGKASYSNEIYQFFILLPEVMESTKFENI